MELSTIIITLAITIVFFLFCRELVCWYFKINEVVSILKDIREHLKKQ